MNKSESKYFNTALRMDVAFLDILEKKEFPYITVKEICEKAGVNRSTFYLHYESISDLLNESIQYIYKHFLDYMKIETEEFIIKLKECKEQELYLITPKYLNPYLNYIKQHKRLFKTAVENSVVLRMEDAYTEMFQHVFTPILDRFNVENKCRSYMMAYYIHGLMAIISEWLKQDCRDDISYIVDIIIQCVMKM